jgi:hypothetical protein
MTQIASLLDINDCFPIEYFSGVLVTHKTDKGIGPAAPIKVIARYGYLEQIADKIFIEEVALFGKIIASGTWKYEFVLTGQS